MAYQVLARKWRPQVFEEVIGQPFVVKTLQNALSSGRLGQAYLFCGPRGVGKTTVARILAKALNCRNGPGPNPCNTCSSCKEITAGISPDVQEIDGASNRGIEEIRNLRENVKYLPTLGKKRVFIIDEVHMLTIHAFNALLKTLEEPPNHVVFIFATTEPHKVPATILSRCQRFDFMRIPPKEMARHLLMVAQKEGIQIEDAAIELIVKRSEGSMRDAQSLLDQLITFVGPKVTHEEVEELLGEIESALVGEACIAIAERNPKGIFETVKIAYEKGYDLKEFYKAIMEVFKDALYYLSGAEVKDLGIPPWKEDLILRITRALSPEILSILLGLMLKYFELLRYTDEIRILLEVILVRLSIGAELLPLGKLLDALTTRSGSYTLPISE
ncbi:MAG: DNA polymerase III subunit gamma/tau, partial [Desulfatiglandales bacterium]